MKPFLISLMDVKHSGKMMLYAFRVGEESDAGKWGGVGGVGGSRVAGRGRFLLRC